MHTFGATYDPKRQEVSWWLDGELLMYAGAPDVRKVAAKQNFYFIIAAQTHGKHSPYTMLIGGVRAFVQPSLTSSFSRICVAAVDFVLARSTI